MNDQENEERPALSIFLDNDERDACTVYFPDHPRKNADSDPICGVVKTSKRLHELLPHFDGTKEGEPISIDINLDYDKDGRLISIEILTW